MTSPVGQAAPTTHRIHTVVKVDRRTGRLIRTVVVNRDAMPAKQKVAAPPAEVRELVDQTARAYDVDPLLVHSVIQVESNYDPFAISNKGAEGLMQLIPATARRFGVKNTFDPKENIDAGVRYLKYLQGLFGNDRLALAAYNAGEGAVARYGEIPPYPETREYVSKVGRKYDKAKEAAGKQTAAEAVPVKLVEEHPPLEQYQDEQGRLCLRTR